MMMLSDVQVRMIWEAVLKKNNREWRMGRLQGIGTASIVFFALIGCVLSTDFLLNGQAEKVHQLSDEQFVREVERHLLDSSGLEVELDGPDFRIDNDEKALLIFGVFRVDDKRGEVDIPPLKVGQGYLILEAHLPIKRALINRDVIPVLFRNNVYLYIVDDVEDTGRQI